jgi:SAM-dependent methyltransferase
MIAYDAKNNRLAIFQKQATPDFWNTQWQKEDLVKKISSGNTYHFIKRVTYKYIEPGGRILEGGCGSGQVVSCLQSWGYDAYGVDFAAETISEVVKLFPKLQLSIQDVRRLEFPDKFFDGYWSLGVIEHFWEGYKKITTEAHRVLKPGGYLFVTFPWMSPLRKIKVKLSLYPKLNTDMNKKNFYEFLLNENSVKETLKREGWQCVEQFSYDALKGLKDEMSLLRSPLQKLYKNKTTLARAIRYLLTMLLAPLTGHMMLLVCKKTNDVS